MKKYEFLEHPADIKILSYGKNVPDLFVNQALGMMEFLYGQDIFSEPVTETENIHVTSENLESLLVDWLSKILYLTNTHHRAYTQYKILIFNDKNIKAQVGSFQAKAQDDIKAVTYSELKIEKIHNLWQAQVVYDI